LREETGVPEKHERERVLVGSILSMKKIDFGVNKSYLMRGISLIYSLAFTLLEKVDIS
jgi:hypothetical protein